MCGCFRWKAAASRSMGPLLGNFGTSLTLLLAHLSLYHAHREHKVHNIVLYPDKESWCKTTPIKQVVTWPSCSSQELDNNVCVGACFSYMVPHDEPSAPGDLIRPYCDSCQPIDSIWHTVTLECKDKDDNPTTMQKKVQMITNCSCSSCMESSRIKPDFNSLLQSLELESSRLAGTPQQQQQQQQQEASLESSSTAPEQPATLGAVEAALPQQPAAPAPALPDQTEAPATSPQAPLVLQQDEPPSNGQPETPDLLLNPNLNGSIKGAGSGGRLAHERFLQLFKQLNDPNLPAEKLEKLGKLESLEKLEKLEKLASEYAGAKELLAKLSDLLHKYSAQDEQTGIDPLDDSEPSGGLNDELLQLPSSSSAPPAPELPAKDDDDEDVPSLQDQQLRVAASLLHRTGPHHSMVLDSGVKEKIDVESHYLHPALAGQEISYHDNVLLDKTKKKDF